MLVPKIFKRFKILITQNNHDHAVVVNDDEVEMCMAVGLCVWWVGVCVGGPMAMAMAMTMARLWLKLWLRLWLWL